MSLTPWDPSLHVSSNSWSLGTSIQKDLCSTLKGQACDRNPRPEAWAERRHQAGGWGRPISRRARDFYLWEPEGATFILCSLGQVSPPLWASGSYLCVGITMLSGLNMCT